MMKTWCGLLLGLFALSCSGSVGREDGGHGDEPTATLTGTWYVTGQQGSETRPLVISLAKDRLEIRDLSATVDARRSTDNVEVSVTGRSQRDRLVATQTGGGLLDTGALPIDPTGHWSVS